jgi:hypothetical protein
LQNNAYAITVLYHFVLSYLIHCTILFPAPVWSYTLHHVELELKEQIEQTQAEDPANLALDQGKSQCITTNAPCLFYLNHCFMFYFVYALSL